MKCFNDTLLVAMQFIEMMARFALLLNSQGARQMIAKYKKFQVSYSVLT